MKAAVLLSFVLLSPFCFAQDRSAPDPALAPFYHGVASGDPTSRSVILWTRVTDSTLVDIPVDWVIGTDTSLFNVVATGSASVVDPGLTNKGRFYRARELTAP